MTRARWRQSVDPRNLLRHAAVYNLHSRIFGPADRKRHFVDDILRPQQGDRVLDIGCGTAPLLDYMPEVEYVGFDLSKDYVDAARQHHGRSATFMHSRLTPEAARGLPPFDLVMAAGVVHHLDDADAEVLFRVAFEALKPNGRLVTCDGVWVDGQHPVARILLSLDRGRHIRGKQAYEALARRVFSAVTATVHHDLNALPYSHCVMECRKQ